MSKQEKMNGEQYLLKLNELEEAHRKTTNPVVKSDIMKRIKEIEMKYMNKKIKY